MQKYKKLSLITALLIIALALFTVSACAQKQSPYAKVVFDKGYTLASETEGVESISYEFDRTRLYTLNDVELSSVVKERAHHKFLGYYDSLEDGIQMFDENGQQLHEILNDVTLYAMWEPIVYEKAYVSSSDKTDVTTLTNLKVKYGDTITKLSHPYVEKGYEIVACSITIDGSENYVSQGVDVRDDYKTVDESNMHVWLNNSPINIYVDICKYDVTLDNNNGTNVVNSMQFEYGSKVTGLPVLHDDPDNLRDFAGWSTKQDEFVNYETDEQLKAIDKDVTLYAYWYSYRIVKLHKDATGENYETAKVYRDIPFEFPYVKNDGFVNDGWYTDPLCTGAIQTTIAYAGSYTNYYGAWIAGYTITFDLDGGTIDGKETLDTITLLEGDIIPTPAGALSRPGYNFMGWNVGNGAYTLGSAMPNINITAKAVWAFKTVSKVFTASQTITDDRDINTDYFSISDLKPFLNSSYKLTFHISIKMYEKDDGYQKIKLKNDFGTTLKEWEVEHGGSGKQSSSGWHNLSATVLANNCTSSMYFTYGARGTFNDDWVKQEVVVSVTVSKA